MKLYISTGNSRMEKKWNGQEMEFSVFLERLSHTVRTSETMEQYRKMSKAKQDSIKDVDGFVLGKLKGGRRKKANVLFRSGLTLDMDYATEDIAEQIEMFFDFRCLIYSTHKHTPEKPRLRLIIPLSRTVSPDEYAAVARKVAEDIGMELFDDTTYEPSRLMYWPSTSADGEFFFRDIPGTFLNPDSVLERYADWRDSSSWPVSSRQKAVVSREMKKQADPLSKEGIVGAFCRTYSIEEAIRIFLPDVYQESMMPERFDYIPADSQAGVVIYEGKFAYSHHATDPACGKLLNAFDIVRIHKFGEQDDKAEEGTDSGKLPSFKAMFDLFYQENHTANGEFTFGNAMGTSAVYLISKEKFEPVIKSKFKISSEVLQSKTVYYPCEEVYEYKPRGLEETEYPEYPYPEVIGYVNNDDGTLTLKVQAVFPYRGVSKAYIHEVTVRDTKDGGIQYVGNRIIEPINNPEIRWHVPRLTRTEWEELYGDN